MGGGGGVGSFQIVVSWKETFKELKHAPSALLSYIDLYKHAGFFEEHEKSASEWRMLLALVECF